MIPVARSLPTMVSTEEELTRHEDTATRAREYYKATIKRCKSQWSVIKRLTNISRQSRSEREELQSAQHCFTLTISANYQQSRFLLADSNVLNLASEVLPDCCWQLRMQESYSFRYCKCHSSLSSKGGVLPWVDTSSANQLQEWSHRFVTHSFSVPC